MKSIVCLDIDGTITPSLRTDLELLKNELKKTVTYINTARPTSYCNTDLWKTTKEFTDKSKHYCFNGKLDMNNIDYSVNKSKVRNMDKIFNENKEYKELKQSCVILIDDVNSNIESVKSEGYDGIKVNPEKGITKNTIEIIKQKINMCEGSV